MQFMPLVPIPHGILIHFVFNNTHDPITGGGKDAITLGNKVSGSWMQFAHSGNPNNSKIPDWPEYNSDKRATMIFDNKCRIENDPGSAERHIWATI